MILNFLNTRVWNEAGSEGGEGGGGPATPPAAPAQSPKFEAAPPATPPAEEPPAEPKPKAKGKAEDAADGKDDAPAPVQYKETGDAQLDYVLSYVGGYGFGPDHPAIKAAEGGNFDQLEVELAKLDAKGASQVVNLARKSYESYQAKAQEQATATQELVHNAAGGEEQWQAIQQWAGENATDEEKEVINSALAQGGPLAGIVVQWLASNFRGNTETEFKGRKAAKEPAPTAKPDASAGEPLSVKQFAAETKKLYQKYGNDYSKSPEYKALAKRRANSR